MAEVEKGKPKCPKCGRRDLWYRIDGSFYCRLCGHHGQAEGGELAGNDGYYNELDLRSRLWHNIGVTYASEPGKLLDRRQAIVLSLKKKYPRKSIVEIRRDLSELAETFPSGVEIGMPEND